MCRLCRQSPTLKRTLLGQLSGIITSICIRTLFCFCFPSTWYINDTRERRGRTRIYQLRIIRRIVRSSLPQCLGRRLEKMMMEGKHWTGTRVFYWGSDAQVRYGTVLESTRMDDVHIYSLPAILHGWSDAWRSLTGYTSFRHQTWSRTSSFSPVSPTSTPFWRVLMRASSAAGVTVVEEDSTSPHS